MGANDMAISSIEDVLEEEHLVQVLASVISIKNHLGIIYVNEGNYYKARAIFKEILEMEEVDLYQEVTLYHNFANTYLLEKNYDLAKDWYELTVNTAKQNHLIDSEFYALIDLGEVFFLQNDFSGAIKHWLLAEVLLRQLDEAEYANGVDLFEWLSKGYKSIGSTELSNVYRKLHEQAKLGFDETSDLLRAQEEKESFYRFLEKLENEKLQDKLTREYKLYLIALSLIIGLFVSIIFVRMRRNKKRVVIEKLGDILLDD